MTDETVAEKIARMTGSVGREVEEAKPSVISHLEAFGTWTRDELAQAAKWIAGKL